MFQKKYAVKLIVLFAFVLLLAACQEKCNPIRKKPALFFIDADTALHITKAIMLIDKKDTFHMVNGGLVQYYPNNSSREASSQVLYYELPLSESEFELFILTENGKTANLTYKYKVYPIYNTCTDLIDYEISEMSVMNVENQFYQSINVGFSSTNALSGFLTKNIFNQTYEGYTGIEIH